MYVDAPVKFHIKSPIIYNIRYKIPIYKKPSIIWKIDFDKTHNYIYVYMCIHIIEDFMELDLAWSIALLHRISPDKSVVNAPRLLKQRSIVVWSPPPIFLLFFFYRREDWKNMHAV